jgi:hypothetical protein
MTGSPSVDTVDPRAPRFGQAITGTLTAAAVAFQEPLLVATVALVLGVAVLSNWRADAYGFLWRRIVVPLVGPAETREPASPHRFAKLVGAAFTVVATPLVLVGGPIAIAGYALAGLVSVLALLGATTGFCLGCRMYEEVSTFRRLGIV